MVICQICHPSEWSLCQSKNLGCLNPPMTNKNHVVLIYDDRIDKSKFLDAVAYCLQL
nr:hypothetical protein [uncultured Methanobrevibacter sp.]